jgi:hypothetical protein
MVVHSKGKNLIRKGDEEERKVRTVRRRRGSCKIISF